MTQAQKLLVVDDEIDVAFAFKLILERYGLAVDMFHKPLDALTNFKAGKYDLALLDVKMPEMNGFELYQRMKNTDDRIKVCFMTAADVYREDFKRILPELADDQFMLKPIENDVLVSRIEQLLHYKQ